MTQIVPPRMTIVWTVLEAAKDAGDEYVIAACRRLIAAEHRGWRKHHDPSDYSIVREFYEMIADERAARRAAGTTWATA